MRAWIWLAVATLAVTSLARAQAGIPNATVRANPVFEFLTSNQYAAALGSDNARHSFARPAKTRALHRVDSRAWRTMLPVLFVGLIAPLNLVMPSSELSLNRSSSAPALPFRFQRPPPSLL
jgi:hypothetical protein